MVSLLVGKAIEEGKLESIDLPISDYIPELLDQDARFQEITIRQLLEMSSPICHHEMKDGLKAYYSPDLQELVFTKLKWCCLLYTSPSPRDATLSRMPSSA